ncbi:odorant receptor 47a-like [Vespula maculifrons]|uniref:Odorant receptor 47a-like n=1 Tax=Vespula maculifrons TaxID=7453 RepID=A0ABD2AM35_VESMC
MIPSVLNGLLYTFDVIDDTQLILPFRIEYFLQNSMHYYFILLYEIVAIIIICTVGVANYSMFISFTQHACALFNIVRYTLLEKQKILRYFILYYDLKIETFVLQLFELLPLTENINDTLKRSLYISANLFIIYIYCYLGQKLINNSTGLLTKW